VEKLLDRGFGQVAAHDGKTIAYLAPTFGNELRLQSRHQLRKTSTTV
jgi:hypothetical protein